MVSAKAVFYCILYSISYAAAAMFTRFLSVETPKYYIPGLRAVLQVLLLLPVIYHDHGSIEKTHSHWFQIMYSKSLRLTLFARAILGLAAYYCYVISLDYVTLGDASAIRAAQVPLTTVIAFLWLGETINNKQKLLIVISVTGIGLITQSNPPTETVIGEKAEISIWGTLIGIALGVISVVLAAIVFVAMRSMGKRVTLWEIPFSMGLIGVFLIPGMWLTGAMPLSYLANMSYNDLFYATIISVLGITSQVTKKVACDHEKAAIVAILCNLAVVASYALQWVVLGNVPNTMAMCGAALILVSAIGLKLA